MTFAGVPKNYRGLTFSVGGYYKDEQTGVVYDSVEKHFTVANALKKYNPNLKGFSTGVGDVDSDGRHSEGYARRCYERILA